MSVVVTRAGSARAGEVVTNGVYFTSGTSVENLSPGPFYPAVRDDGGVGGPYYWAASDTNQAGRVVAYASGAAYDYGAHGLRRNAFLAEKEPGAEKYLQVNAEAGLHRSIFSRAAFGDAFSNVVVRSGARESIYCDLLTKFTAGEEVPVYDSSARIVVWARVQEEESGDVTTNLAVTAGYFANDFTVAQARTYSLDCPIDVSRWYRLTIRAHGDVSQQGVGRSGFSIYLDGEPVRAVESGYEICAPGDKSSARLTPEARALVADRRFFPSLATPGSDAAFTVSGLTFVGEGCVDDVTFSSDDPGYAKSEAVFTFQWDGGFASPLKYTLDGGVTTNDVPVDEARSCDILIGHAPTNGLTLTVTDFAYKTNLGFRAGVWFGSNGAKLTNDTEFVYDGSTRNPVATVASTRETADVGPGGYDTFASAIAALDRSTNAVKTLRLLGDVTISKTTTKDAYGNRDYGYANFTNATGEYVLDLDGHTLKGSEGKLHPTLVVSCKSLRIIDSSADRTGCIKPVGSYQSESPCLNTSVLVYPNARDGSVLVQPVLTLQDGIYDGWVRNDGSRDATTATTVKGTVYVEGGTYYSTNDLTFYLESSVTNETMQFVYREPYWEPLDEDAVIWTGLGDGRSWTDGDNWRVHRPPNANETALFPSRAAGMPPWTVDVGVNQMTTMNLWLEGDVFLTGTNAFRNVSMSSDAKGRFSGDATLVYEGDQPGKLTATTLRDDWAGTVILRNIGYKVSETKIPKVLRNIETWGTDSSTVVFNGVRGYVMDIYSHTMPYAVTLEDLVVGGVTYPAWENDSGYTGSALTFLGALRGTGTFQSGANSTKILQLLKFADVQDFHGKLTVNGKRVLLGSETVMSAAVGLIAFGDDVVVNTELGWTCKNVIFGQSIYVNGDTNDVIVTSTQTVEPDVTCCSNVYLNGMADIAWLATTNTGTASKPIWNVYVTGERPAWLPVPDSTEAVIIVAPTFASARAQAAAATDSYSAAALRSSARAQALVAVEQADVSISVDGDDVILVVSNTSRGLWYAVRHRDSLDAEWTQPAAGDWRQATGNTVTLSCPRTAESGFYGVVVSYEDPAEGGKW